MLIQLRCLHPQQCQCPIAPFTLLGVTTVPTDLPSTLLVFTYTFSHQISGMSNSDLCQEAHLASALPLASSGAGFDQGNLWPILPGSSTAREWGRWKCTHHQSLGGAWTWASEMFLAYSASGFSFLYTNTDKQGESSQKDCVF